MSQSAKDQQGNPVRFIRKNGKIIPIRNGGGSSIYKKQENAAIDSLIADRKLEEANDKYKSYSESKATKASVAGMIIGGIGGASLKGRRVFGATAFAIAGSVFGSIGGSIYARGSSKGRNLAAKKIKAEEKSNSKLEKVSKLNAWDYLGDSQVQNKADRSFMISKNKNRTGL